MKEIARTHVIVCFRIPRKAQNNSPVDKNDGMISRLFSKTATSSTSMFKLQFVYRQTRVFNVMAN